MSRRPIPDKFRVPSPFDPTVHKTERTANQKMVEWINRIIREKDLDLGLAEQETTAADGKQPDIVILERPTSSKALCVIELKRPYFDPFDEKELKEPAREKATARKARYFATSNFKRLIWYNTEREVKVPEDESILERIVPDLEGLKKRIVETINGYLNASIPLKLRRRIQHQLWGEMLR